ncbi:MAG: extracellular solute-binding protein [Defluviitaleaceae bacterium]|nr:extracellular solute-binding protein [Defluviitaleaceae bacterium]
MRRKTKLAFIVMALLAIALTFAACNRGGNDPSPSPTPAGNQGATTPSQNNDPGTTGGTDPAPPTRNSTLDGLDFGGATIRIGVAWEDPGYMAMIPYFEQRFNARVEYVVYGWDDNEYLIAQGMAGNAIDIVFGHHLFFPGIAASGAVIPLDEHILPGDWAVPGVPGGLSTGSSAPFMWENRTYFVGSSRSNQKQALFYNKLLFQEAGLEDPFELYLAGQWTWDRFLQMSAQVTDPANGIHFAAMLNRIGEWWGFTGVYPIIFVDGVPTSNIDSPAFFASVESYRDMVFGSRAVSHPYGDESLLYDGSVFMARQISEAFINYRNGAEGSSAFAMNSANMGMVPVPIHPLNTVGYPGMAAMAWGAGFGTQHPEAAIAWALLEGERVKGIFPSQQHEDVFENIWNNSIISSHPAGFSDSEGNGLGSIINPIFEVAAQGGDIASAIAAARPGMERLIADTIAMGR